MIVKWISKGISQWIFQGVAKKSGLSFQFISYLLALIFTFLSLRKIFEPDVFILIRAGEEILKFQTLQVLGHWSHTVNDQNWLNYEWLSSVVFYGFSKLFDHYLGLSLLRAGLVFLFFNLVHQFARSSDPREELVDIFILPILSFSVFAILAMYFELRAGIFTYIGFASLLLNWTCGRPYQKAIGVGCLILIVVSNFHSAISSVLLPVQIGFIWFRNENSKSSLSSVDRTKWSLVSVFSIFLTPLGFGVIRLILRIVRKADWELTGTPDLGPFRWKLLDPQSYGFGFWIWIGSIFFCVLTFILALKQRKKNLKENFPLDLAWLLYLIYTFATFVRVRIVPYQVMLSVLILGCGLKSWLASKNFKEGYRGLILGGCVPLACVIFYTIDGSFNIPLGFGVFSIFYPTKIVEIFETMHPAGELCNSRVFGGYLIDQLRAYPVSVDTRSDVNLDNDLEMRHISQEGDGYRRLTKKWNCNSAIYAVSPAITMQTSQHRRLVGGTRSFFPKDEWAMVFFEDAAEVFLRRIPEHLKVIAEHEYHCLDRSLPIGYIADSPSYSEEERRNCVVEIDRCLLENPKNAYCLAMKGTILRSKGMLKQARGLLTQAKTLGVNDRFIDLELDRTL